MGLFDWKKNKKESKEELEENAVLTPDNAEVSADGKNEQDAKAEKDEKRRSMQRKAVSSSVWSME